MTDLGIKQYYVIIIINERNIEDHEFSESQLELIISRFKISYQRWVIKNNPWNLRLTWTKKS